MIVLEGWNWINRWWLDGELGSTSLRVLEISNLFRTRDDFVKKWFQFMVYFKPYLHELASAIADKGRANLGRCLEGNAQYPNCSDGDINSDFADMCLVHDWVDDADVPFKRE